MNGMWRKRYHPHLNPGHPSIFFFHFSFPFQLPPYISKETHLSPERIFLSMLRAIGLTLRMGFEQIHKLRYPPFVDWKSEGGYRLVICTINPRKRKERKGGAEIKFCFGPLIHNVETMSKLSGL